MGFSDSYIKPNVRQLEKDKNIAGLIKALSYKDDWHVQNEARDALGRIGKLALEPLIKAIKNENEDVRRRAATALGEIKDASSRATDYGTER